MAVKALDDLDLDHRRVLVRVDYNVPLQDGAVADDTRIRASLPTLEKLIARHCKITLMSHLGRPKGVPQPEFSMKPAAARLAELLDREVALVEDIGDGGQRADLQMLENLRFWPGEKKNDETFARDLARYGDVYVNDAFGAAHRAHASISAVCRHFDQKGAGLLLMKELHYLKDALASPQRPFLAILGGSKISDKLKLIENLLDRVDQLVIGGAMSYTFLKAQGVPVGKSMVEEDFLAEARRLIDLSADKGVTLALPLDHLVAGEFKEDSDARITLDRDIEDGAMGLDIGPETINRFIGLVRAAKTVVWNGPMGVFEWDAFSTGTISIAEAMAESEALTIIGGGDSVSAANKAGVSKQITHISTGGGASLELLGGRDLPGVTALES